MSTARLGAAPRRGSPAVRCACWTLSGGALGWLGFRQLSGAGLLAAAAPPAQPVPRAAVLRSQLRPAVQLPAVHFRLPMMALVKSEQPLRPPRSRVRYLPSAMVSRHARSILQGCSRGAGTHGGTEGLEGGD